MRAFSQILSIILLASLAVANLAQSARPITVADAALTAAFYPDSSCLLTIDAHTQSGKTVIDANVDSEESRMLIHCDTDDGRRLTLLARGDSLNVSMESDLLTRQQIEQGEQGMIAWLTRSNVHYADDSIPRRYVIGGSVYLRKSPPDQVAENATSEERRPFGRVVGLLEPLLKSGHSAISQIQPKVGEPNTANTELNEQTEHKPSSAVGPEIESKEGNTATDKAESHTGTDPDSSSSSQLQTEVSGSENADMQ